MVAVTDSASVKFVKGHLGLKIVWLANVTTGPEAYDRREAQEERECEPPRLDRWKSVQQLQQVTKLLARRTERNLKDSHGIDLAERIRQQPFSSIIAITGWRE